MINIKDGEVKGSRVDRLLNDIERVIQATHLGGRSSALIILKMVNECEMAIEEESKKPESFSSFPPEERKHLRFEAGKADAAAGYPPSDSTPEYLEGYSEGYRDDGSTSWDVF